MGFHDRGAQFWHPYYLILRIKTHGGGKPVISEKPQNMDPYHFSNFPISATRLVPGA